ncbi:hypothetical protein [Clostridium sp.]|uniref:hypothetical protein n=1 Tax=Clostridium sp. TaxID=1506 RepID=UPI0026227C03|nr:hypothetical protein [Clostridium sp.]
MKKFNFNEFISLLILVLITMILGYLVLSKNIYNYLETSDVKSIYLVLILNPILILVQGMKVFTFNSREDNSYSIIPIVIALVIIIFVIFRDEIFRIKEFILIIINRNIF